jgi:hypothetical protein
MTTYVVECAHDEMLVKLLVDPKDDVIHLHGRDRVITHMTSEPRPKHIGMVDEDPTTSHSATRNRFKPIKTLHGVLITQHNGVTVIMLRPFLEAWLISAVKAIGKKISAIDKGLHDDPSLLHKSLAPSGDQRLRKVLATLEKHDSKHLLALRQALNVS